MFREGRLRLTGDIRVSPGALILFYRLTRPKSTICMGSGKAVYVLDRDDVYLNYLHDPGGANP